MEPFVIQCTTCRARLKVSDPALVGDIVGCPKCESFVQVTPPPGWQPPLPGAAIAVPSAGAAATNSASGTIPLEAAQKLGAAVAKQPAASQPAASQPAASQPAASQPAASQPAAKQSAATRSTASQETVKQPRAAAVAPLAPPPLPAGAPAATGSSALAKTTAAKTTAPRAAVGTSSLIVPEPAAEPSALTRLLETAQEHYWIASGSLASLAAIVTIAWLALASKTEVAAPTDSPAAEVALGSDREPNSPAANEKNTALESTDGHNQNSDSGAANADAEQRSAVADASDSSGSPNDSPDVATPAVSDREPKPAADRPAEDSSSPASSLVTGKRDPLDPIARALATEPEPLSSTNPGAAPVDRPAPGPAAPSDDVASSAARTPAAGADDPADEFDGAKQAKLVAHLQDKIPPTEFRDIPLGQFLTFLSELSTVPIAIDAESLQKVDKSAKTKITVKLAGGTVEDALRAALAKPGLSFHVEPKRILVTAGTAARP